VTSSEEGTTRVDVLAEHATLPDEVDVAAARARAEELRQRVEGRGEAGAGGELAKALMRVRYGTG
jgi:F0F1-type ATP synthase epsilon subunit